MRIVVALGGNALLERGQKADASGQIANVEKAAAALAPLARAHELVITHGNGPQIGMLALESANDPNLEHPFPFDTLGAQTQGMIGYWLMQALGNCLPDRQVSCLVNRTRVDRDDPAFAHPTKFIGQTYDEQTAQSLAAAHGWAVRRDGEYYRRVIASPRPQQIVELPQIRSAITTGAIVVCAGGGGIPVVRDEKGALRGVEAVIDKDLTAMKLALDLRADGLLILTDVAGIYRDFGTAQQSLIRQLTPTAARALDLPAGSMQPKMLAACEFVEGGGSFAAIGKLADARDLVEGKTGTIIARS